MSGFMRGADLIKVGLLGIAATLAFFLLFGFVTNRGLALRRSDLYVRVPTASGLRKGDPVVYRGVTVGEVRKLSFAAGGSVVVRAKLLEPLQLSESTTAELVAVDLFGRQSLVLRDGNAITGRVAPGDTISGVPPASMASTMSSLSTKAGRLIGDSTTLLLHATLANTAQVARQLDALAATLQRVVEAQEKNMTALTEQAVQIARNINTATQPQDLVATRERVASIALRLDSTTASLDQLVVQMRQGDGSVGKLLRDPALYDRTQGALAELEALLRDIRKNPKRYINVKVF